MSPNSAVAAVQAAWGLSNSQIVSVASANISKTSDAAHSTQENWLVVANEQIPAVGNPAIVVRQLVMVVDGRTGRYLWAYSADPVPAS